MTAAAAEAATGRSVSGVTEGAGEGEGPENTLDRVRGRRVNRQDIHGQLASASYTNFANSYSDGRQRMRYTLSLAADQIGGALTGTVTWMQSAYLNGMIYGGGYDRELLSGKLSAGVNYHFVDQTYSSSEEKVNQHIAEANLHWAIWRKLSLSVNYEGTFEKEVNYHRIYLNLSQRL